MLRRTSRSGYAARRKCLRPNPGPPKSEGLVLRIYTYDKYRRTHARNPLKKRVSVKKSSAFLLTKIKTKNHDARFAGRPEGMHPGVERPLPCPCGAFLQPAGTLQGVLAGTKAAFHARAGLLWRHPRVFRAFWGALGAFRRTLKPSGAHPPAFRGSPRSHKRPARLLSFVRVTGPGAPRRG